MTKKELWVKFKDAAELLRKEGEVHKILAAYAGEIRVTFYMQKANAVRRTNLYTSEKAVDALAEILGEDSVKITEREEHLCSFKPEPEPLERIADALEAIQKCLEDITSDHSLSVYANGSINVD